MDVWLGPRSLVLGWAESEPPMGGMALGRRLAGNVFQEPELVVFAPVPPPCGFVVTYSTSVIGDNVLFGSLSHAQSCQGDADEATLTV